MTGPQKAVAKALDGYHVFRQKVSEGNGSYTINHTASIFLIDEHGKYRDTIAYQEADSSALAKLKRLEGSH